jgi:hypothetical protein
MFYTYHGCHGNIFPPNNIEKNGFDFHFSPKFWKKYVAMANHDNMCKTFCEQKISGMFKKCYTLIIMVAMVIYFFSKIFVKYEHFSNQTHFFNIIFKSKNFLKYQEYYSSLPHNSN